MTRRVTAFVEIMHEGKNVPCDKDCAIFWVLELGFFSVFEGPMCKIELGNLAAACCREAIHASAVRWDALPTELWELELLGMDEMYILLLEEYIEGAQDLVEYSTTAVGDLLRHWMPSQQIDSASLVIDRNPVTPDEIAGVTKVKIYNDWVEFTPALL